MDHLTQGLSSTITYLNAKGHLRPRLPLSPGELCIQASFIITLDSEFTLNITLQGLRTHTVHKALSEELQEIFTIAFKLIL